MTIKNKNIEELLEEIEKLQGENFSLKKRKKYGLVWENKIEKFDEESKNSLPVLKEKGGKFKDIIEKGKEQGDYNILIEGDNYHSLSVLNYTHRKKIDVIYIDPPYNTGNKDFIYNDKFIDKEDTFRHSKWLSFMEKRLKLAKSLLKDDGVIFISIDDNEQAQLKLLCDEIFGEGNFASNMIWESNKNIMKGSNFIRKDHEYILFYISNTTKKIRLKNENLNFQNIDNDLNGEWLNTNATYTNGNNKFSIRLPSGEKCERNWRFTKKDYENGKINLFFNGNNVPRLKIYKKDYDVNKKIPSSLLLDLVTTTTGKNQLAEIFKCDPKDVPLDNPKDTRLLKYLFKFIDNKKITILDFFAGSGTTGHAVLDLNKEDGGNRKFILCTNNENKICEKITYERIKRVSKGYTKLNGEKVEGLGGNIKYLKTDFVKKDKSIDDLKEKIVEASTEILCLKENSFKLVKDDYEKKRIKIFKNKNQYTAVLFDVFYFDDFIGELKKLKDKKIVIYIFSYGRDFSLEEFEELNGKVDFSVEAIPEKLLETYQKIFNL